MKQTEAWRGSNIGTSGIRTCRNPSKTTPESHYLRGYGAMFSAHIGQADEGCDFDFLQGQAATAEPEIH